MICRALLLAYQESDKMRRSVKLMALILSAAAALSGMYKSGEYCIPADNTIEQEEAVELLLKVPYYSQEEYPTGCELVSASMLLGYYGFETNAGELIGGGHIKTSVITEVDGVKYGGDPDKVFIGSPYDENSYGCYSGAIKSCLESYLPEKGYEIADLSGKSLGELCGEYISSGIPVLVWASIEMDGTYKKESSSWIIEDTGEQFQWISGEHCMVLVGCDENYYWFNDPYNGNGIISYEKSLSEQRYSELGKQALAIILSES